MFSISITAKQELIKDVKDGLSDKIPEAYATTAVGVLADTLGDYEVESAETSDDATEKREFLEAYIDAKRIEGRSAKTIEHYAYVIGKFYESCNRGPRRTTVFHIRKYLADCKTNGNSDRTIEGYRSVLNGYFAWLAREGITQTNPVANIAPIHYEKKVREPYSDVDLFLLNECCENNNGSRCTTDRNRAIIAMLEATGCRVSELCGLNRDDINFTEMECVVHGKGNKDRVVYLNNVALMLLQRYLYARTDDCPALFIGKRSDRLTPGGIRFMLKQAEKSAGVTNVHPHKFRRTLATNLIDHGMPIQEVSRLLGHERLDTTMGYVYIDQQSVKNSYYKYI